MPRFLLLAVLAAALLSGASYQLYRRVARERAAQRLEIQSLRGELHATSARLAASHREALLLWGDSLGDKFKERGCRYEEARGVALKYELSTGDADARLAALAEEIEQSRPAALLPGATARLLHVSFHEDFPLLFLGVSVRDRSDAFLGSLQAKDFSVTAAGSASQRILAATVGTHQQGALSLVVLIDSSNSTTGEPLSQAKAGTKQLASQLPDATSIRVFSFGEVVRSCVPWTSDPALVLTAVDRIASAGNTPLLLALDAAITSLETQPSPRGIVLFTDGRDTSGGPPVDDLILRCQRLSAPVHAVSLRTQELDARLLEVLSKETGGTHRSADRIDDLAPQFAQLTSSLAEPIYRVAVHLRNAASSPLTLTIGGENSVQLSIKQELSPTRTVAP